MKNQYIKSKFKSSSASLNLSTKGKGILRENRKVVP